MHHVADVRGAQVNAQGGRKPILELGERRAVASRLLQTLLPCCQQPGLPLQLLAERGHERLQRQHPVFVVVHVLADLVDHDEERAARAALLEHVGDRLQRLAHRALVAIRGADAAVYPGHGVTEDVGL